MSINIGLGIGTREQNRVQLNDIWDKQMQMITVGGFGTLVTPENLFNTATQIVKNANFKQAEDFFTDADEIQPQNDEQTQLAQQQMKLAERQQELDTEEQDIKIQKLIADSADKLRKFELARDKDREEQRGKEEVLELKL